VRRSLLLLRVVTVSLIINAWSTLLDLGPYGALSSTLHHVVALKVDEAASVAAGDPARRQVEQAPSRPDTAGIDFLATIASDSPSRRLAFGSDPARRGSRGVGAITGNAIAFAAPLVVSFDDRAGQDQMLNGQYPSNVIDWGTGQWYHSGPWGAFTTKSVSFAGSTSRSATFTFLSPRRLVSFDVYNGGGGSTTITVICGGQPSRQITVPTGQIANVATGWTGSCTTVTMGSTNGWDTNFDNLIYDDASGGQPTPTATLTSTSTATLMSTPTATLTPTIVIATPSATPTATLPASPAVRIVELAFQPADWTINVGDTVTWTNDGAVTHTTTSSSVWSSGPLAPSQTFSWTFSSPGVYPYLCSIHPSMQGTVTVLGGELPTPTITSTPTSTSLPTAKPTSTSTRTVTPTPIPPQTVTFDDRAGQDQLLEGHYPAGVIDWGTGAWLHSGPFGSFTTKSISFSNAGIVSAPFTFLTPRRLVSV
jgi:plastocyanin